jgi:hypothetical protein
MFETSAPKYGWMNRIIAIGPTVPFAVSLRFSDSLAAFRDLPRKQIAGDGETAREFLGRTSSRSLKEIRKR